MKLKFWQKTYILTLIIFLISLNAGIFSLAVYTHGRDMNAERENCRAEVYYIAQAFERDYSDLMAAGHGADPKLLTDSYCAFYAKRGVLLEFVKDGETVSGTFTEGRRDIAADTEGFGKISGERYFLVSTTVSDGEYSLVYGRSFAETDRGFARLMITFVLISVVISVLVAAALFVILRRVSAPLDDLKNATGRIASGDHSVKADESAPGEFGQLGKSFNEMVDKINGQIEELRKSALLKQRLVDDLAHEIRTPLTVIYGYAEYLLRADTSEDEKINCANAVMKEAKRLQNVSEKLLDSAVMRENPLCASPTDLKAILDDTASSLAPLAREKGVEISACGESAVAEGDATLLGMLFYNLAENAIKACEKGGKVQLFCKAEENGVTACVSDDGKGMTADQLEHITDPFYRTDVSRSRAIGGAGLGLTLCSRIAEKHQAKLSFRSSPGEGTEVFVFFPKSLAGGDNAITT
ncbi:MAG: HAMP domain-containing histidine kinase [Clostridia bacterium]|nr:HAMP domain-containing histidine kinase [Clostridia bacterium]